MAKFCCEPFAMLGVILQHLDDNRFGVNLQIGGEKHDAVAAPAQFPFDAIASRQHGIQIRHILITL